MKALFRMKKIAYLFCLSLLATFFLHGKAYAQPGKKAAMKSRNKLISNYTTKSRFGKKRQYTSAGLSIGSAHYFGDLNPRKQFYATSLKMTRTHLSGFYTKRFSPNLTLKGELFWARISGDDVNADPARSPEDAARYIRNLHFRNDLIGLSVKGQFELFPTNRSYLERPMFNPYGFIGLEVFYSNPKAVAPPTNGRSGWSTGEWVSLRNLKTEGKSYSAVQFGIPFGFGLNFKATPQITLGVEIAYHIAFTDYLDDVSTEYVPLKDLSSDLSRAMSRRSAETVAARTGANRNLNKVLADQRYFTNVPEEQRIQSEVVGGQTFSYVKGHTDGVGNPRGSGDRDYFITTAVHAAYILQKNGSRPKFR
jgi:hypothetical protein